jgi:RNA polymerase sigma-70 factor, ECF subfamily
MTPATEQPAVSDADLLQRYLAGEDQAFATLVRRYEKPLFTFLVRFTGNRSLAEDVFQDTFLQVHHSAGSFDPSRRFKPWLYTVAANKARDALRKTRRHPEAPLDAKVAGSGEGTNTYADLLPADIPAPEEFLSNRETRQAVQQLVEHLPEYLREVLALSYLKELPQKDIAALLDIPVGTVKSRLHAAVRVFAEKWKALLAGGSQPPSETEP